MYAKGMMSIISLSGCALGGIVGCTVLNVALLLDSCGVLFVNLQFKIGFCLYI